MPITSKDYNSQYKELKDFEIGSLVELSDTFKNCAERIKKDEPGISNLFLTYSKAINTVSKPIGKGNTEETVQEAINHLGGLQEFLLSEKNNEKNIDRLLKGGTNRVELFEALSTLNRHLKLGMEISKIKGVEEEYLGDDEDSIRQSNASFYVPTRDNIIKEDDSFVHEQEIIPNKTGKVNAEEFLKDVLERDNFTSDNKKLQQPVKDLLSELQKLIDYYEDIKEKAEKYPKKYDKEEAEEFSGKLDTFRRDIRSLQNFNVNRSGNEKEDKEYAQNLLNSVNNFKVFLISGEYQTNYQKITNLKKIENFQEKSVIDKEKLDKGLDSLDYALRFEMSAKEIQNARAEKELELEDYPEMGGGKEAGGKATNKSANKNVILEEKPKDAVVWLEEWREKFKNGSIRSEEGYPGKQFARIMAARYLAESDIGYADKLYNKPMTLKDIDKKANELLKNSEYFRNFIKLISDDPEYKETAEKCAKSGHGGGLDKMLIKYINKKPAGSLKNDAIMQRYMPTVKDRIEELQRQAKVTTNHGGNPYKEVAEILTLRNMIDAQRDRKSCLNKQIPTVTEKMKSNDDAKTLDVVTTALSDYPQFQSIVDDDVVRRRIKEGHGGWMIERMQELNVDFGVQKNFTDYEKAIAHGTYGARMENNKEEAKRLKDIIEKRYDKMDANERGEIRHQVEKLLADQIALATFSARLNNGLNKGIEWDKVNEQSNKMVNDLTFRNAMFPDSGKVSCQNVLNLVIENKPSELQPIVSRAIHDFKYPPINEEKKVAKNEAKNNNPEFVDDNKDLEENVANFKAQMGKAMNGPH